MLLAIFKPFFVITGIYEIDTAAKIADALKVTLDFLVKDAEYQNIDNDALKRLKLLEKLSPEDKNHIFALTMLSSPSINSKISCNKKPNARAGLIITFLLFTPVLKLVPS